MAGSGTAAADPTPPTALTWDIPAPTPRSEIRSQDAARLAITKLDERIKRAPDSAHLYVARGQQYGRVRNERACLNDLLVAKVKGATDSLLNLYLAHASLLREQAAEAQKYLEQQRTLTPNSPEADIFEARLWLARPGILSQNSKQALLLLEKAIALDSTNQKARLLRGYTYFATNKPAQAIGDY